MAGDKTTQARAPRKPMRRRPTAAPRAGRRARRGRADAAAGSAQLGHDSVRTRELVLHTPASQSFPSGAYILFPLFGKHLLCQGRTVSNTQHDN